MFQVTLPWPPSVLNPNSRAHWRVKDDKRHQYHGDCYVLARSIVNKTAPTVPAEGKIPLNILFYPPNDKFDGDNALAAIKAGIDALARAIGVNDRRFLPVTYDFSDVPKKGGAVHIQVGAIQPMSAGGVPQATMDPSQ